MKKTKTPQTLQLQEPDTQSKRRLSLPKVAYSAFLCVMMSMMFCQPAYAATDVWTKAKEIMREHWLLSMEYSLDIARKMQI